MKKVFVAIAVCFLFAACAKIVTPSGGAVDRIPPKQLKSYPEQNSLNFKEREFVIEFDEYIVLDNVMQNLLVSPPLKVKPEVNAKLKKVYVTRGFHRGDNLFHEFRKVFAFFLDRNDHA